MVRNSKYLVSLLAILTMNHLYAQDHTLKRDMEICRITLENHLKQWNQSLILNSIEESRVQYDEQKLTFTISAPHAQIFLTNPKGILRKVDGEMIGSFYNNEMIALQQKRLFKATQDFLADFHSYLPKLKTNEEVSFQYIVSSTNLSDKERTQTKEKNQKPSDYTLSFSWNMENITDLAEGTIDKAEFAQRANLNK